jgi:hypothetical protein
MSETKGFAVKVTLLILTDTEGRERLLPPLDTLEQNLVAAKRNLLFATGEDPDGKSDEEKSQLQQRVQLCRNQIFFAEQTIGDYNEAKRTATAVPYTILTPDYGTLLEMEDAHRIEKNGMPSTDMAALARTVTCTPEFIEGISDATSVRPTHMRRLWDEWLQAVYPDPNEIPTPSTPLSMPSQGS